MFLLAFGYQKPKHHKTQPDSLVILVRTGQNSGRISLSVAESVAFWIRRDEWSTNPQNETISDAQVIKSVYAGGANGTEVILYTLVGYAHLWPSTSTKPIRATDIIWDFFASHPKQ